MTSGLDLFPRPRFVEERGPGGPAAGSEVRVVRIDGLAPEGFELELDDAGATLRHGDSAGLRYGTATFEQIRAQSSGERLPSVLVRDHPDFPVRGYMLDVSRDRVPTRQTLERLVHLAAVARLNHLQLYVEHTFAHAGHETVWEHASPLTPGDLAWLDARCAAVGIELVGCRNSLGHFERWLRHDAYRPMAECPDGFEFLPGVHMPAGTLAPNPENAAFAVGLIREMTSHLTSRQVNVCADEPFELGKGVSAARCAAEGKEAVYVEHLRQIVGPLVDEGFAVRFWADVIRHAPHLASRLPEGSTAIAWEYEAPRPHGDAPLLPAAMASVLANAGIDFGDGGGFADQVPDLASTGFPFWVAPGTSSWNSLVGRIDNAVTNLIDAAESGLAHGAGGYLITDWGDNGHLQPPAVSDGPMLFGGAVAWCLDANRDLDVAALLDRHAYDDPSGRLGAAAVDLGRLWGATGQRAANGSPIQKALLPHQALFVSGKPEVDRVVDVLDRIDAAMASIGASEPRCPDGRLVAREWMLAAKLARAGAVRMLARARASESPAIDFSGLIEEASACWILRSRPGGLSDSVAHLERTAAGAL